MDVVISSKMHPAVFSTSEGTPTVCIAYDHKQIGFFDVIDLPDCIISIQDVEDESLLDVLNFVYDNRNNIREKLFKVMPQLKKDQKKLIRKVLSEYVGLKGGNSKVD
jgi:polysaccharide pyruvyl transferase WcaK-like protein